MRRMNLIAFAATIALAALAGFTGPVRAQVTVFEGARLIVGDGSAPIENATLVVKPVLDCRMYQTPVEGRYSPRSVLPSPS